MNTSFKPQRVLDIIDSLQALYEHDMPAHIYRWHATGTVADWHQMIDIMRNFAVNRPPNMRQHIITKWNLSGTIEITADVSSPQHGSVKVNSILINEDTKGITGLPYPWTGTYFRSVPVPVKAIAKPGYVFKEWEGTGITTPDIILTLNHDTAIKALFEVDTTYQNVSLSINELMAVNNSFITDEYGAYDDWLEIYNPGNDTVDISGYYITDDPLHITKYQIPGGSAETRIAPHGFMLLWADDEPQQGPLHLPFKLATAGEKVLLHAPNQTLKDSVSFGYQLGNRSYGRYPDASPTLVTFTTPTPGASNVLNSTSNIQANDIPFMVYPNPARHTVYFSKTSDIKVYNSMGRLLAEKEHALSLDISDFGKGIYLIHEKMGKVVKLVVF